MDEWSSRFWAKVNREGAAGCWLWTGAVHAFGYGVFRQRSAPDDDGRRRMRYAHRLSWEMANGPIPPGMAVLHRCDVPACCNPAHLFLGTDADNVRDMVAKGRVAAGAAHGSRTKPASRARGAAARKSALTDDDVRAIRAAVAAGERHADVAARHGVARASVGRIVRRESWSHVA